MATYDEMKGTTVYDTQHDKIGALDDFYVDDHTNQPTWVTVKTGLFGNKVSFVPLAKAKQVDDGLQVAFTKEQVKGAPQIDGNEQINQDDEAELYGYYSSALGNDLERASQDSDRDHSDDAAHAAATAPATNPHIPDSTADTRESAAPNQAPAQAQQATQPIEAGRVRLQKYIITENITYTVPVQREEVRVIRDNGAGTPGQPVPDGNPSASGGSAAYTGGNHPPRNAM